MATTADHTLRPLSQLIKRAELGPAALPLAVVSLAFSLGLAAQSYLKGDDLHSHFQNPGLVNTFSTGQSLLVAAIALWGAFARPGHRTFWLLFAGGFVFFALDQQWKDLTGSAEQDLHAAIGGYVRDHFWLSEPFLLQWSDALVGGYLVVGLVVVARHRHALYASDRIATELVLALGFAAVMILIDSFVVQVPAVKVVEETFKLLSGAFFLAAVVSRISTPAAQPELLTEAAGAGQ